MIHLALPFDPAFIINEGRGLGQTEQQVTAGGPTSLAKQLTEQLHSPKYARMHLASYARCAVQDVRAARPRSVNIAALDGVPLALAAAPRTVIPHTALVTGKKSLPRIPSFLAHRPVHKYVYHAPAQHQMQDAMKFT